MRFAIRRARPARLALTALLMAGLGAAVVVAPNAATAAPAGALRGSAVPQDDEPGDRFPLFDFTDRYYQQNGVNVAALVGRRSGTDGLSVVDKAPDGIHRDVRVTFTLPGYDLSGHTLFWTVLADLAPNPFTADKAGREARKLAEASPVYVFPTKDGDPLGVGNSRQADMIDTSHGYFSNNPLGLWVHVFVSFTDKAFNTQSGREALAELRDRNGVSLDGTPIIASSSELQSLKKDGFVTMQKRPKTMQGRYFVCPVFKDPRDGGIADDAFLATIRRDDGTALPAEQHFVDEFQSLQDTGDWP